MSQLPCSASIACLINLSRLFSVQTTKQTSVTTSSSTKQKIKNSGCPSTLRVVSASTPFLQGNYVITNQKRRGQPVWHNKEKNIFILVAKSLSWQIKPSKNYIADDNMAYAYSEAKLSILSGKLWCPQNVFNMV